MFPEITCEIMPLKKAVVIDKEAINPAGDTYKTYYKPLEDVLSFDAYPSIDYAPTEVFDKGDFDILILALCFYHKEQEVLRRFEDKPKYLICDNPGLADVVAKHITGIGNTVTLDYQTLQNAIRKDLKVE